MAPYSEPLWLSPQSQSATGLDFVRNLGMHSSQPLGAAFSQAQNHAILVVGVTMASISLVSAIVAFQWFALMKRSFRHHLIFLLIISDMIKALWFFIFPIVVFTKGTVDSSSGFCQASGFFLALGTEASDYAILMIALHAALYVFRPQKKAGEGGLYPYRYWVYAFWVILPVLAASLAFTSAKGYVTSGTYCTLPKRPFWYRLGLSFIPRYLIFGIIFTLYAAITIYVHKKFRGFSNIGDQDYDLVTGSRRSTLEPKIQQSSFASSQNTESRKPSTNQSLIPSDALRTRPEWENVDFITTAPLKDINNGKSAGVTTADFAAARSDSLSSTKMCPTRDLSAPSQLDEFSLAPARKESEVPTLGTTFTGVTRISNATGTTKTATTSQLQSTRAAILRQLRLLFIYPVVYVLMWIFPFISHCMQYSDYFAMHPPFWLSIVVTCSLALQAFADCLIFTWREKPWRRVSGGSMLSARRLKKMKDWSFGQDIAENGTGAGGGLGGGESPSNLVTDTKRDSNWWEAEGRKRKDSVWLGTDTMQRIVSQQEQEESDEEAKAAGQVETLGRTDNG